MNKNRQRKLQRADDAYAKAIQETRKALLGFEGVIALFSPGTNRTDEICQLRHQILEEMDVDSAVALRLILTQPHEKNAPMPDGSQTKIRCWPTEVAGRIADQLSRLISAHYRAQKYAPKKDVQQEAEELVRSHWKSVAGKEIMVSNVLAYEGDDRDEYHFDQPIKFYVLSKDQPVLKWREDWLDSEYEVELSAGFENDPRVAQLRSFSVDGLSVRLKEGRKGEPPLEVDSVKFTVEDLTGEAADDQRFIDKACRVVEGEWVPQSWSDWKKGFYCTCRYTLKHHKALPDCYVGPDGEKWGHNKIRQMLSEMNIEVPSWWVEHPKWVNQTSSGWALVESVSQHDAVDRRPTIESEIRRLIGLDVAEEAEKVFQEKQKHQFVYQDVRFLMRAGKDYEQLLDLLSDLRDDNYDLIAEWAMVNPKKDPVPIEGLPAAEMFEQPHLEYPGKGEDE